jgi:hypothetical protein
MGRAIHENNLVDFIRFLVLISLTAFSVAVAISKLNMSLAHFGVQPGNSSQWT